MQYRKFSSPQVEAKYKAFSCKAGECILQVREMIFTIAEQHAEIGVIQETLKWDSPSYLTSSPKSGTSIRLNESKHFSNSYLLSVHCQSKLLAEVKALYPEQVYDGNRSLVLNVNKPIPMEVVEHFIYLALTYHSRKRHIQRNI